MALPLIVDLSGAASLIAVLIVASAHALAVGLRGMSQPGLPPIARRMVGRYMLIGVAVLLVAGATVIVAGVR